MCSETLVLISGVIVFVQCGVFFYSLCCCFALFSFFAVVAFLLVPFFYI